MFYPKEQVISIKTSQINNSLTQGAHQWRAIMAKVDSDSIPILLLKTQAQFNTDSNSALENSGLIQIPSYYLTFNSDSKSILWMHSLRFNSKLYPPNNENFQNILIINRIRGR